MIETLIITPSRLMVLISLLLATLFLWPAVAKAAPEVVTATDVTVQVEGKSLQQPVPPVIVEGRLLIGVRAVGEAVGGLVDWNAETRQVTITRRTDQVVLTIGEAEALVNGQPVLLDVPPLIHENRTMVPLRFIGEALGGTVNWDGATRTANFLRKPTRVTNLTYTRGTGKSLIKLRLSEPLISVTPTPVGSDLSFNLYPATIAGMEPVQPVSDSLIRQIEMTEAWRQVVLKIDLTLATSYRHTLSADGLELTIELDHLVTGIATHQDNRISTVTIGATGTVAYKTLKLKEPYRLVIDLPGSHLTEGVPASMELEHPFITRVRTAQFDKETVRVVLDMTAEIPAEVVPTDQGLQVRFVPQITAFKTDKLQGKTKLTFTGSLPMDATITALPEKKQIQIAIPQGMSGLKESLIKIADGTVETVTLANTPSKNSSLITIQLPYYLGHTVLSKNGDSDIALELTTSPVYGKRIWIDAGHGNIPGGKDDPGTIGAVLKLYEKNLNLAVSLELQKLLQSAGATVYMTRTGDSGVDFRDRPALVNALKPPVDLFLSIHHNSAASPTVRGVETYYWTTNPKSRRVAELVHPQVIQALGFPDRKIRADEFYVIKATLAPSILIELGYLSNADEEKAIAAPGYPAKAAQGIQNGVLQYFWQEMPTATAN